MTYRDATPALAEAARAYRAAAARTAELENAGMSPAAARTKTSLRAAWNRVKRTAEAAVVAGVDRRTIHETINTEVKA